MTGTVTGTGHRLHSQHLTPAEAWAQLTRGNERFVAAAAPLIWASAWMWARSRRAPEIGKFSTARWVWARHSASAEGAGKAGDTGGGPVSPSLVS